MVNQIDLLRKRNKRLWQLKTMCAHLKMDLASELK